jgi:hypothetical protein
VTVFPTLTGPASSHYLHFENQLAGASSSQSQLSAPRGPSSTGDTSTNAAGTLPEF